MIASKTLVEAYYSIRSLVVGKVADFLVAIVKVATVLEVVDVKVAFFLKV